MNLREQMEVISACNCRITKLYGDWARLHGLSYSTMMTLYAIHQSGPCTQKQISGEWLLPKQTVHTVVKDLADRGLVALTPGRDQKEKLVDFTEEGRRCAADTLRPLFALEERVLDRMGGDLCCAMVKSGLAFTGALEEEVLHG